MMLIVIVLLLALLSCLTVASADSPNVCAVLHVRTTSPDVTPTTDFRCATPSTRLQTFFSLYNLFALVMQVLYLFVG